MKSSLYFCKHCGKTIRRDGVKAWRKGYCEQSGKDVRVYRVKSKPKKEPK